MKLSGHTQTCYYISSGNVIYVAVTVRGEGKKIRSMEEDQETDTFRHPSKLRLYRGKGNLLEKLIVGLLHPLEQCSFTDAQDHL